MCIPWMIVYTHSRPDTPIEGPFLSPLTHRKMQQAPGLGWMSSSCLWLQLRGSFCSYLARVTVYAAQRREMKWWAVRDTEREVEQKGNRKKKSAAEQVQEKAWKIVLELVERWKDR